MFDIDDRSSAFLDEFDEKQILHEINRSANTSEPFIGSGLITPQRDFNTSSQSKLREVNIYADDAADSIDSLIDRGQLGANSSH